MMKRQKNLLLLVGVLAVLCVGIFAVTRIEKHIDKVSTVSEDIITADPDTLTKISWTVGGKTLTFTKGDDGWAQDGDAAFPVDQDKISDLIAHFEPLTASFIIHDVTDYSQYGLDKPTDTVTLTTQDGDTTLSLGSYSTMDQKRYVMLEEGTVYLIDDDVEEALSTDHDDFLKTDSVPEFTQITKISRTGDDAFTADYLPKEMHSYTNAYHFYTDDGTYTALSDDKITTFVTRLENLDWSDYATYQASESDLGTYGLASPAATFTIDYETKDDSGSFTVSFGKVGDDKYYCRMNDSAIVCNLSESDFTSLSGTDANALRPSSVLTLDWDKVKSLDFTLDDVTCAITHKGDKFLYNDEEADFDSVQSAVNALSVGTFNSETPGEKKELEFTVTLDNADYPTLTVAAYRYDGENCLVQLNGETLGLVPRSQVSTLREAVTAIALGKADSDSTSTASSTAE